MDRRIKKATAAILLAAVFGLYISQVGIAQQTNIFGNSLVGGELTANSILLGSATGAAVELPFAPSFAAGQLIVGAADGGFEIASGISYAASQLVLPAGTLAATKTTFGGPPTTDVAASDYELVGSPALPGATVNMDGGSLTISGGPGASGSAGTAGGGDLILRGGKGYGTGADGIVRILRPSDDTKNIDLVVTAAGYLSLIPTGGRIDLISSQAASTANTVSWGHTLNTLTSARAAFLLTTSFSDITDSSRTSLVEFVTAANGVYGKKPLRLIGDKVYIDYDALSVVDPGIKGELYRSASGALFVSAGP